MKKSTFIISVIVALIIGLVGGYFIKDYLGASADIANGGFQGMVVDKQSKPIAGATIQVVDGVDHASSVAKTDSGGLYRVLNYPTGEYEVFATYNAVMSKIKTITVVANKIKTGVNFTIPMSTGPGGFSGNVKNQGGLLVPNALITASGGDALPPKQFTTLSNATGQYAFSALPPGIYSVYAKIGLQISNSRKVTVVSGVTLRDINLIIKDVVVTIFQGNVKDSNGVAISGAQISTDTSSAMSSDAGFYQLIFQTCDSSAITKAVSVSKLGYTTLDDNISGDCGKTTIKDFILKGVGIATITGKVYDKKSKDGIPNALVRLMLAGPMASATTDSTGKYTITVTYSIGTFDITASANGYISDTKKITLKSDRTTNQYFWLERLPMKP